MPLFATLLLILSLLALSGCGGPPVSTTMKAAAEFEAQLTNSFSFGWPARTARVNATSWSYRTPTEGSRTRVLLKRMETDVSGISGLLTSLEASNVQIFENVPIRDRSAKEHADWWNPEEFGEAQRFKIVNETGSVRRVLMGTIPTSSSSNRVIFLQMIVVEH